MAKFKVGDRVRIINSEFDNQDYKRHIGSIVTIRDITNAGNYLVKGNEHVWYESELELIENVSPVYQFCITYYYVTYGDGTIDTSKTRRASIFASDMTEAIDKLSKVDKDYQKISEISFHEIYEGEPK